MNGKSPSTSAQLVTSSQCPLALQICATSPEQRVVRCWEQGAAAFYEVNDLLQYLGFFAFRGPVPAYKHNAAMFLKLRGWIGCDDTHPGSAKRPESDRAVLAELLPRIEALLN